MTAFTKAQAFVEHKNHGVHNLGSNQLMVVLSNTAPSAEGTDPTVGVAANCIKANITEIAYTNLSTRNISTASSIHTTGTYKLTLTDLLLTSSGGTTGPFRYVYIVNDTPTSPADPVIGYYDYGSSVTLQDGETFNCDFDDANGVMQDT
jgi:hypothetical protein